MGSSGMGEYVFFFIYVFLLFGVLILYFNPRKNISQQLQSLDYGSSIIILLTILSLGGIPPLLGFLGKIIIIKQGYIFFNFFFLLILVFRSLIILFLYINFCFTRIIFIPRIIRTNKIKRFSFLKRFFCFSFFGFTILVCFFI